MIEELGLNSEIIASLKRRYEKQDTQLFDISDFTFAFGSPLDALMYVKLFWPDFIEYFGMIFHADVLDSAEDRGRVRQMIADSRSSSEIEKSFNQFQFPSSFFGKHAGDTSSKEDTYLASVICGIWQARLKVLFPDQTVSVICTSTADDEPSLTVFQDVI